MSDFLLSPLTWLATATLLLVFGKYLRPGVKRVVQGIAILALFACTPLCANALLWLAEHHPGIANCSTEQGRWPIVMLTAGFDRPPRSPDDSAALNKENFERMDAARRLALAEPASLLQVSGGGREHIPEAVVVARLLEQRGIPRDRMRVEAHSRTTWENASALHGSFRQVQLVTSPAHLQRAAMAFDAAGIESCAVPAASGVVVADGIGYVLPRRTALAKTEQSLHELVGRGVYAWRAWRIHVTSNRS